MFAGDCKDAAAARKDGLLTTYASIEPCRAYLAGVVWYAVCCRTSRAPPHPRTGSLSQARYSMRVPAVHCSSVHSGGTARWSPSLAGSRSRRRRVPQARRPSCGRWSRWRCGPRRSRRSSWPPLAARIGANGRSRGSTGWRCSRGRRTRWPRTRSSTPTPSPRAISWSRRSGSGSSNASARASFAPTRYTLLAAETLKIIVNHMVRLAGLRFSPCGPPAEERAREALLYWPTDALLAREACCSEDQSY
mmetsp:Transcript_33525/g.110849  ORF Transcript_33525/g.110849 Transcript_33525/m.110849 type:complete len:248 (-) Transcript_33525:56-799(-)